jgi:transposase
VVVESTGGLERLLVSSLQLVNIAVAVANPRRVKGFAIALGKAKTDKLDAQVLAQFAQSVEPRVQSIVAPEAQHLSGLVRRTSSW